jgi:hypothetical protein
MASTTALPVMQRRNSIEDVHGPRTPYKHVWPARVDEQVIEEPESWVQSACVLCRSGAPIGRQVTFTNPSMQQWLRFGHWGEEL